MSKHFTTAVITEHGDKSVGERDWHYEVQLPFLRQDRTPEDLEEIRTSLENYYQEFCEQVVTCEYEWEFNLSI